MSTLKSKAATAALEKLEESYGWFCAAKEDHALITEHPHEVDVKKSEQRLKEEFDKAFAALSEARHWVKAISES